MPLRLVIDPTTRPAAFGRAAAREARCRGATFLHIPAVFDLAAQPDAAQYVHAAGGLGPSGLFFAERILGRSIAPAVDAACILATAAGEDVVVPIHPAFGQDAAPLRTAARRCGIPVEEAVSSEGPDEAEAWSGPVAHASVPTIVVIGREEDHRHVHPAALISLLDAAEALGTPTRITFAAPLDLDQDALEEANGILLPGGSEMGNVPAQLRAAHHALVQRVPVLGLRLGMQSMTTAFARIALADRAINLAEADPRTLVKSFTPMGADILRRPTVAVSTSTGERPARWDGASVRPCASGAAARRSLAAPAPTPPAPPADAAVTARARTDGFVPSGRGSGARPAPARAQLENPSC